jgi:shikimate dehydrogenase
VIVGAGGSARAVGTALATAGCARITVANRTPARGEDLVARLAALGAPAFPVTLAALARGDVLTDADLVVNTTPLGLSGARLSVRHAAAPRRCLFVDLVYGTRPTPFLARAARTGHRTLDGAAMLLEQGALAFEAWTGRPAPRAAMARALRTAGLTLTEPATSATVRPRRPPAP